MRDRGAYGPDVLARDLAAGKSEGAYLVTGEEEALRTRARRCLESLVPEDARGMDFELMDGSAADSDWAAVASAARTLPWTSPHRLVVVDRAEDLSGDAHDLLRYLADPSERVVLALFARKVDRRTRPWKDLVKLCREVTCEPLDEARIASEARRLFDGAGVRVERGVLARLLERVGPDLARVESEVEKLCLLAGEGGTVRDGDVESLLGRSREREVWDFTDALARVDRTAALRVMAEMQEDGASSHYLVAMAAWNTRRLLTGMDLVSQGSPPAEAARAVKAWGEGRKAFLRGLREWDRTRLRNTLRKLAALDRTLKSSPLPERLLIEEFVLDATSS